MGKKITAEQAIYKIKNEKGRKAIKSVKDFFVAREVYLFKNGETIVIYNDNDVKLYNYDESKRITFQLESNLHGHIDVEFLNKINKYINDLKVVLKLKTNDLDFTMHSIYKIDSIVAKLESRNKVNLNQLYMPLIAYLGEVIIKNNDESKWSFENIYSTDHNISERSRNMNYLIIKMNNGNNINLPQMLKTLFINNKINGFALVSMVETAITQSR